jgi:hypothetical protein
VSLGMLVLVRSAAAQTPPPEPPPPVAPWYEALDLGAFADAYASVNFNFPKPQAHSNRLRAFDDSNGVALSWVGLDASYDPDPVGGAIELRFGPSAARHAAADAGSGLEFVKQAYAGWRPGGGPLRLDFGKFDTIYGAEADDSQDNWNYSIGALSWIAQPNFHAGLHATWQLTPAFELHGLVVNGWDHTLDNNIGKTFGVQLRFAPSATFGASLGWLGGPEQDDSETVPCAADFTYDSESGDCVPALGTEAATYTVDRGGANAFEAWRHLFDLVLRFEATETLQFVLNASYGLEGVRRLASPTETVIDTKRWYGAMLAARFQIDEIWAVAGRGEYLADVDGNKTSQLLQDPDFVPLARANSLSELALWTATLTLEAAPTQNLLLRLEGRGDFAAEGTPTRNVFDERARDKTATQITTTLGVVVKTD